MADKSLRSVIAHIADLTRNIYTGDYPVDVKEIVQALNGRCIGIMLHQMDTMNSSIHV